MQFKKEFRSLLIVYLWTWVLFFLLYCFGIWRAGVSITDALLQLLKVIPSATFLIGFHLLFLIVYILFLIGRFTVRGYKNKGWITAIKRLSFTLILPVLFGFLSIKGVIAKNSKELYEYTWNHTIENTTEKATKLYDIDGKHRGMSVFWSYDSRIDYKEATKNIIKDNIEWSTVIPFIDQENEESNSLRGTVIPGVWSRRDSSVIRQIRRLQEREIRVHLKPHIWLVDGWRSNIQLSEEDWDIWFESYRQRMLQYARIAETTDVPLFCIGTELRTVIQNKPDAWLTLIKEIQQIYSGALTYALNWDDPIESIPFWDEMDYIGIQAYFPLTTHEKPSIEEIKQGWDVHIEKMKEASQTYKKPILFTEVGYRSDASATIKPWEWGSAISILTEKKSDQTQQFAFEAMFQKLWNEPWFAGCYIWQWHTGSKPENAKNNVDFTPRFKPAENTITKWYGQEGEVTISGNN